MSRIWRKMGKKITLTLQYFLVGIVFLIYFFSLSSFVCQFLNKEKRINKKIVEKCTNFWDEDTKKYWWKKFEPDCNFANKEKFEK